MESTPILATIEALANTVTAGLELAGIKNKTKYIDKKLELMLRLKSIQERPFIDQDDVEIVSVFKEFTIWAGAVNDAMLARSQEQK